MNNKLVLNRQTLNEIIQEEYQVILKEERLNKLIKEYKCLPSKEKKECQLIGLKFYSNLYESNLISNQDMANLLLEFDIPKSYQQDIDDVKSGKIGSLVGRNVKDFFMMGGPAGFALKKLGLVNDPLELAQLSLTILGFIPGAGEIADGINAAISLMKKDYIGAALNAISMIPELGDFIAKPIAILLKAGKGVPLKYVQKILPALEKYGPTFIQKTENIFNKLPIGDKKEKIVSLVKNVFSHAKEFFSKYLTGSADDIAKNLGQKAADVIKNKKDSYNTNKAAEREIENPEDAKKAGMAANIARRVLKSKLAKK